MHRCCSEVELIKQIITQIRNIRNNKQLIAKRNVATFY